MEKEILRVNNLKKYFSTQHGTVKAVNGVSFSIYKGETFGVVGESGSGKSTIAGLTASYIQPNEGQILVDDIDMSTVSLSSFRNYLGVMVLEIKESLKIVLFLV